jgi:hypothetical protein
MAFELLPNFNGPRLVTHKCELSAAIETKLCRPLSSGAAMAEASSIEEVNHNHRKPKLDSFTSPF